MTRFLKKLMCSLLVLMLATLPALAQEENEFQMELIGGETVGFSDYEGYVTLFLQWATWCPNCIAEMPVLQQLQDAYPDTVRVIAINQGEDRETVEAFVAENDYTFDFALDPYCIVGTVLYPSNYMPYLGVLDEEGHLVYYKIGGGAQLYEEIAGIIELHQMFNTAPVYDPALSAEGELVQAEGSVHARTETGFEMMLEDGTILTCVWANTLPEEVTRLQAVGVISGGSLEAYGLKMQAAE